MRVLVEIRGQGRAVTKITGCIQTKIFKILKRDGYTVFKKNPQITGWAGWSGWTHGTPLLGDKILKAQSLYF